MNKQLFITAILMLAVGISIGIWLAGQKPENGHGIDSLETKKPLFYRHPMNPSVTSPVPVKDDMGMPYAPVYAEDYAETTDRGGYCKNRSDYRTEYWRSHDPGKKRRAIAYCSCCRARGL